MNPNRPDDPRPIFLYRGSLPLWLAALLLVPVGLLFLFSLAVALSGGVLGLLVLPVLWHWKRRRVPDRQCIELDASEWRTIDGPPRRDPGRH